MERDEMCSAGARAALASLRSEIETLRGLGVADLVAPPTVGGAAIKDPADRGRRADFSRYTARPSIAATLRTIGESLRALSTAALEAAAATQSVAASDATQVERRVRWGDPAADAPSMLAGAEKPPADAAPWWRGARAVPVNIAGGAAGTLSAIVLPATVDSLPAVCAAVTSNDLYYVPAWNHFAFRIGARVLHGNIGRIASAGSRSRERPLRTLDCRRASCRQLDSGTRRECPFYHNPAVNPGSFDVRDYVAGAPLRIGADQLVGGADSTDGASSNADNASSFSAAWIPVSKERQARQIRADAAVHDILTILIEDTAASV